MGKMYSNKLPPLDPCSGTKTTCKSISPADNDPISHSFAMLESIIFHLLDPNEVSRNVAAHLLRIGQSSKQERMQGSVNHRKKEFGFAYRCFMCRRYLGEPLSNALNLPCPDTFSLSYGILFALSTLHLVLLRSYTLCTMHIPYFKKTVRKWHARGMVKFYNAWEEGHNKRMRKVSQTNKKNRKKNFDCPFAMVMQPKQ